MAASAALFSFCFLSAPAEVPSVLPCFWPPHSPNRLLRSLSADCSYVRALRCTRPWFESSLHVPRKICSRTCQPSLYCSLRHSQQLGCLKYRETVHDAQLKCSSQAGREQCGAASQVRSNFRIATLIFGAGPRVCQPFGYEVFFPFANLLMQRHMDLAWAFAQLHPGAIGDNRRQPRGHLRLSPELVQMFAGGQHRLLHRILCVSSIPQKTQSTTVKRR